MKLIDSISVSRMGEEHQIMLLVGDVTAVPINDPADLLVVSAFPDDYTPTSTSVIGALHRRGVSVAELAEEKEVDLRAFSSCWLSRPLDQPDVPFGRILCFEPRARGRAPEVVGDVFRSLVPFAAGVPPMRQVVLPLLASGDQGEPPAVMLQALVHAALQWLSSGLPIRRLKIVVSDSQDVPSLHSAFAEAARQHPDASLASRPSFQYDVFVSYCHHDMKDVDELVAEMRSARPSLRMFVDRLELHPGASWQQHIFEALDVSHRIICFFSPAYLCSKVCQEEFNIGLMRHRESPDGVLLPVYAYSASLPTYMRTIQYEDVREGDHTKMSEAAHRLAMCV